MFSNSSNFNNSIDEEEINIKYKGALHCSYFFKIMRFVLKGPFKENIYSLMRKLAIIFRERIKSDRN